MAVLALLSVLVFGVVNTIANVSSSAAAHAERAEKATAIFRQLRSDLSSVTLPLIPSLTDSLQFQCGEFGGSLDGLSNRDMIAFQASLLPEPTTTDIATVVYFLRWDTSDANNPKGLLCRVVAPLSDPSTLAGTWLDENFLNTHAPALPTSSPPYLGLLESGVVGLWVRALDDEGLPIAPAPYDSRITGELPAALEVAIVLLDSTSASRLSAIPSIPSSTGNLRDAADAFVANLPTEVRTGATTFHTTIGLPKQ